MPKKKERREILTYEQMEKIVLPAIESTDISTLSRVYSGKTDIDSLTSDHSTGLRISVKCGNVNTCKFFISKGADVNHCGPVHYNMMRFAIRYKHYEIASLLLKNGVDTRNYKKVDDWFTEDDEHGVVARMLLKHGLFPGEDAVSYILARIGPSTPIGNIRALAEYGVDYKKIFDSSPGLICRAVRIGNPELVRFFFTPGDEGNKHPGGKTLLDFVKAEFSGVGKPLKKEELERLLVTLVDLGVSPLEKHGHSSGAEHILHSVSLTGYIFLLDYWFMRRLAIAKYFFSHGTGNMKLPFTFFERLSEKILLHKSTVTCKGIISHCDSVF